jgi:hypothetical protein
VYARGGSDGNEHLIEAEIMQKVQPLLEHGRYFPNLDHALQPLVAFQSLCRFMTLFHNLLANSEGDFSRLPE